MICSHRQRNKEEYFKLHYCGKVKAEAADTEEDANVCTFLLHDLHQSEKQLTDFLRNFAIVIKATTLTE